ncbi:tyrosine-protein kinase hopscotch-like [Amphibalanus amphitrite]|uniref:tyrosine-protein kinase hopscotch-like n=1 Tax=Amphibalanus amphitrite TaxID=1232801 RepID=UPI001C8FBC19|nr:tyrosine-protein kinase hopscotch-like [Amphibalanus amphitrite]
MDSISVDGPSAGECQVHIRLCSSREPLVLGVARDETAEQLTVRVARHCRIGPVARHLFSLCDEETRLFLAGSQRVGGAVRRYTFLMRFKVADVVRLRALDPHAFDYLFHQVREAFVMGTFSNILRQKEDALGLAVTDMYRLMREMNVRREDVEKDYKSFIPRDLVKMHSFFLKSPIRKHLIKLEQGPINDVMYIKEKYVQKALEMCPTYGDETYTVQRDEAGVVRQWKLVVDPFHPTQPGLRMKTDGGENSIHICTISDICYISLRNDNRVELARKNGVPQYFRFASEAEMTSCVSLLDSYYRLMEKWTFCLSKDLQLPSQLRLKQRRCHGPVGQEFAHQKLREKRNNEPGTYLLRQHSEEYDVILVDVCQPNCEQPLTIAIDETAGGGFRCPGEEEEHASIQELLAQFSTDHLVQFKECLPPSEHDESPLRLCRDLSSDEEAARLKSKQKMGNDQPLCIPANSLKLYTGRAAEVYGRYTVVQRAQWHTSSGTTRQVAVKRLQQHLTKEHLQDFIDSVSAALQWTCDAVVQFRGVCLTQAVSLVMDWYPLGPLDSYLAENKHTLMEVDLVEAGTYLAKALWYLDEQGVTHGKLRCRNVLVSSRAENKFHVRLADPGLRLYTQNDLHWVPVEYFDQLQSVAYSSAADVWSYGTTLWEIFSYGQTPLEGEDLDMAKQLYQRGGRLPPPNGCPRDIYRLMCDCWHHMPHNRKTPQAIMRDINQILYNVFNARQVHAYATLSNSASVDSGEGAGTPVDGTVTTLGTDNTTVSAIESVAPPMIDLLSEPFPGGADLARVMSPESVDPEGRTRDRLVSIGRHKLLIPGVPTSLGGDSAEPVTPISPLDMFEEACPSFPRVLQLNQGQVQLGDRLGVGFYGEVYKAVLTHQDGTWETVAAKRLKKKAISTAGLQDLQREIAILKDLDHENVVKMRGIVDEPELMLVMEYLPPGALSSYLKMYWDKLTTHRLLKFAKDVAKGMEYLGEKKIVHRDLAARNILVASDTHVKISDFGLAQVTGANTYYYLKTNRELPFRWYAPESIRYGKFSSLSDVWSYGITLFEMFSGGEDPQIPNCDDQKLLETLDRGVRLCCPSECPLGIYTSLMWPCWDEQAHMRPCFSDLVHECASLMREY